MGVYEARGQLGKAMKDLMMRWNECKGSWDDAQTAKFEENHLHPLEMDLRNAVGAMEHMAAVLSQVYRDCE